MNNTKKIIIGLGVIGAATAATLATLPPVQPTQILINATSTTPIRDMTANAAPLEKIWLTEGYIAQLPLVGTYYSQEYGGLTIEIRSVQRVGTQLEIYARAFKNSRPLALGGKKGTLEWERFLFDNPDFTVDDPNGSIVITATTSSGQVITRKMREDPIVAMQKDLAHSISVSSNPNGTIVPGSVGHTTTTFNPTSGVNNAGQQSVDGMVRQHSVDESFALIRADQGAAANPTGLSDNCAYLNSTATTNQYGQMGRGVFLFDTSSIGSGQTISAVTLSIDGGDVATILTGGGVPAVGIATSSPKSNSDLLSTDYAVYRTSPQTYGMGSQMMSTGTIAISSWVTGGYNNFGFSSTGTPFGTIATASTSKYSLRIYEDLIGASSAPWASNGSNLTGCMFADNGSRKPKLVVTYSAVGGGANPNRKYMIINYLWDIIKIQGAL